MDTCAVWWSQHGHPHHKSVLSWLLGLGVTRNGAFDTPKYGKSNGRNGESDVSIHFQPLGVPSVRLSPSLGEIDILRLNKPGQHGSTTGLQDRTPYDPADSEEDSVVDRPIVLDT